MNVDIICLQVFKDEYPINYNYARARHFFDVTILQTNTILVEKHENLSYFKQKQKKKTQHSGVIKIYVQYVFLF